MKKILFSVMLCALSALSFAQKYRIADVSYIIDGITKEYAIENEIEISKTRIFNSYAELNSYIKDLESRLHNERNFDAAIVTITYGNDLDIDSITPVKLRIFTTDSKHFLLVPYPKYDSNTGFILKLKMKDTNFLGTLSTLNSDVNFEIDTEDETEFKFGFNLDYDYPFNIGKVKSSWNNSLDIDYTIGENKPEFDYTTGLSFKYPLTDSLALNLELTHSFIEDFDYEEYDDDFYMNEAATVSLPIDIAKIDNWGNVTWSPYIAFSNSWDKNGISERNSDLIGQRLTFGHSVSTERLNWIGNFRNGVSLSFGQSISYNFYKEEYGPQVWAEAEFMKAWKYAGYCSRFYVFTGINNDTNVSKRLRGIKDEQNYKHLKDEYGDSVSSVDVPTGIVINMDLPIHIITTDWTGWTAAIFGDDSWVTSHTRWMRYFDFELQLSPFGDMALTKNKETGKLFSIKDGFYAGGLEMIVYPAKWRSLEVRTSFGIDAGRKVLKKAVSALIDNSWRAQCKAYELYIGIGLHY